MPPTPEIKGRRPGAPEIKGWCPGAHAPMASGDGLLIRAKIVGSRIDAAQLGAVATIAAEYGNGLVDLSQRAQLQLRGVSEATLDEALRRLDRQGLLARDADAERLTNIVASPLAGLDAYAAFDANALACDLARALQGDVTLRALPAKFLFVVDDGSALSLADVATDIRIEAAGSAQVAICVAGAGDRAVIVDARQAIPTALQLARAFLALRGDRAFELRRMRRLVEAHGPDALLRCAGLDAQPYARRSPTSLHAVLGEQGLDIRACAGVAAPFGRWRAENLAALAASAARHADGDLRLTPWRAFIIPTASAEAAQCVLDDAAAMGLVVSADDPRLSVVACPGAPECPQAGGESRNALALLAPLAQKLAGKDGVGLHVSGCAKGCARPAAAPVTLIVNDGRFDLIDDGAATDAPRLTGLTIDDIERALTLRAREQACPTA